MSLLYSHRLLPEIAANIGGGSSQDRTNDRDEEHHVIDGLVLLLLTEVVGQYEDTTSKEVSFEACISHCDVVIVGVVSPAYLPRQVASCGGREGWITDMPEAKRTIFSPSWQVRWT